MSRAIPGFEALRRGPVEMWLDPEFANPLRESDLLEPNGLQQILASGQRGSGRGPTVRLSLGDQQILLRPVLNGGLLAPILRGWLLGLSRPRTELEVTASLRAAGAPVPRAVVAVGCRGWGPLWNAALGTLFEEDTENAHVFLDRSPDPEDVLLAAAAAGRAVRAFHDAGGSHRDLHLGNLLLRRSSDGFHVLVIDLDRARRLPTLPASRRMAELARLYRSAVKRRLVATLGEAGVTAFLHAYLGEDRALGNGLLAHLGRERLRLRLHALHY